MSSQWACKSMPCVVRARRRGSIVRMKRNRAKELPCLTPERMLKGLVSLLLTMTFPLIDRCVLTMNSTKRVDSLAA